ncbi:MAG: hypothetical protein WC260_01460 [Candidatus Pacearchaeota archaeon]
MIGYHTQLKSIIENKNINLAMLSILETYVGDSHKNYKPSLLDMTSFLCWNTSDNIRFSIDKTRNLSGFVKDKQYDVIIYETPKNNSYLNDIKEKIKTFKKIKNHNGIIIVKANDFRIKGRLLGTFEVKQVFQYGGFFLSDNIIYKHSINTSFNSTLATKYNHSEIIHSNFLIFK